MTYINFEHTYNNHKHDFTLFGTNSYIFYVICQVFVSMSIGYLYKNINKLNSEISTFITIFFIKIYNFLAT